MITTLLLLMILLLSACTSQSDTPIPHLAVTLADGSEANGRTINVAAEGEEIILNIESNTSWIVEGSADWITPAHLEGRGDRQITINIGTAEQSRSASVTTYLTDYKQIKSSFNIVQHVTPDDQPSDDNTDSPEDNTPPEQDDTDDKTEDDNTTPDQDDTEGGNKEDNPEDNTEGGDGDNPSEDDKPEDNNEGNTPEDDNKDDTTDEGTEDDTTDTDNKEDNSDEPNNDPTEDNENQPTGAYSKIDNLSQLADEEYFIGGYQDGVLHLATEGMLVGHCKTTEYTFTESGDLLPTNEQSATPVTLEAAADNGYYIHFKDGYLSATAAGAGKLTLTDEKSRYWIFSAHEDGGFVVRQSGEIDVQLIISPKAKNGALLRSVAGDEQGNAIILFRKNK